MVNKNISSSDIIYLVQKVRVFPLLPAFILGVGSLFFQLLRWRLILKSHKLPCGMAVSLKTMFRGFFLAFITPGRIGELFRAVNIDGKRHVAPVVAVVEERSFAVVVTVVTGIVCMLLQKILYRQMPFLPLIIASAVLIVVVLFLLLLLVKKSDFLINHAWLNARFGSIKQYIFRIQTLPFAKLFAFSVGAHFLLLLQTALLFQMFGSFHFGRNLLIAGQAFSLMLFVPFFIANIGLREYSFALFATHLLLIDFTAAQISSIALGVATSILFMNIIIPAVIGLLWIYTERMLPVENSGEHIGEHH